MKLVAAIFSVIPALLALSGDAHAEERAEERAHYYGWEILVVDAVGYCSGAVLASNEKRGEGGAYVALGTYLLAGPVVHFTHGRVGAGFGSLALRVGLPLGGGALGASSGGLGPALGGIVLGALTAEIVDIAGLGWEPAPRATTGLQIAPTMSVGKHDATIGLHAAF
ncbi:MAG: hypothetical protein ACXWUG_17880 [Polyangiales bacterium]